MIAGSLQSRFLDNRMGKISMDIHVQCTSGTIGLAPSDFTNSCVAGMFATYNMHANHVPPRMTGEEMLLQPSQSLLTPQLLGAERGKKKTGCIKKLQTPHHHMDWRSSYGCSQDEADDLRQVGS